MTTKTLRKIVRIDEEKCNGCGDCVPNCVEGALRIVDGKAKLISDKYCDGLGACLGKCPQDAITVEEREADEFSEEAVKHDLHGEKDELPCGCPGSAVRQFERKTGAAVTAAKHEVAGSMLAHWPVQLALVPPSAPFLQGADLLLAAHCTAFAYPEFNQELLKDHALLIACPKLDDYEAHLAKLTAIMRQSGVKSVTVAHMEVPCCSGLVHMARQAIADSGRHIPFCEITIGVGGDLKS